MTTETDVNHRNAQSLADAVRRLETRISEAIIRLDLIERNYATALQDIRDMKAHITSVVADRGSGPTAGG